MEKQTLNSAALLIKTIEKHIEKAATLKKPPLIAIIGPTASGKTGLGIAIAQKFNGEIVSADSRQIYKEMSIATAKPTPKEQKMAKHYLVDCVNPDEDFNLSHYKKQAQYYIEKIHRNGKIPILVGGTGLYISAVTENYLLPESAPDLNLRQKYENLAKKNGKQTVHMELQKKDPDAAAGIHPNNLRYVIRALETANLKKVKGQALYRMLFIYIDWPREELYGRIEQRIDQQLDEGLVEETQRLMAKYSPDLPSISSLGYKEIASYIKKEKTYEEAVEQFKKNTRNYAKRQLTWFRKMEQVYSIPGSKLRKITTELDK